MASVVANVTTQAIYRNTIATGGHEVRFNSIFHIPQWVRESHADVLWPQLGTFALLGATCGLLAVALTKSMFWSEEWFARRPWPKWLKPAIGARCSA